MARGAKTSGARTKIDVLAGRPIAMCAVQTSACWLTTYGFATSMDTTGSSQNRDERLRRRRERERTRRAGETAELRERKLRQRRERDRLDALRRGGRVHCSK